MRRCLLCGTYRDGAIRAVSACAVSLPDRDSPRSFDPLTSPVLPASATYKAIVCCPLSKQQNISNPITNPEFQSKLIARRDRRQRTTLIQSTNYLFHCRISAAYSTHRTYHPIHLFSSINLRITHHACSSIQLVCCFVSFIFTHLVANHHAFNSSPSRIGSFITEEGASQAERGPCPGLPHPLCAIPRSHFRLLNAGRAR